MNLIKQTLLTIFTAIISMVLVYGGYTIYAEDDGELDFRKPEKGLVYIEETYHKAMNEYFNVKMQQLVEILDNEKFAENEDFKAPAKDVECNETNVSTYCVAMGATDMFIDYAKTLEKIEGTLVSEGAVSPGDVLIATNERDVDITFAIEEAELVLDATLATYNEFRLAYPMHKQYEIVINNLIGYKDALEDVRKDVSKFPSKFIDSSSSYCK